MYEKKNGREFFRKRRNEDSEHRRRDANPEPHVPNMYLQEINRELPPGDFKMVATTMYGLEDQLFNELLRLGARQVEKVNRAVSFVGDKGFMYKANYSLRTALHILKPIDEFIADNEEEFYDKVKRIDWFSYLDKDSTIAISSILNTDHFNHSQFVSQKAKDAIVDKFREKFGVRPSVDLDHPDLQIFIHIFKNRVTINLDSSGESLHKRGYRVNTNLAPIKEVMAAGLVMMSGWAPPQVLIDGMCGSGTIMIEAAMMAANIPAGYYRKEFGFQRWKDFDADLFDQIMESQIGKIKEVDAKIIGYDLDKFSVKIANDNIKSAKVEDMCQVIHGNFFDTEADREFGTIIVNPPYGERLEEGRVEELYAKMGSTFKFKYPGYTAYVLSSSTEGIHKIGLKPAKKTVLFNGALECKFLKYELFRGKRVEMLEKEKGFE